MKKKKHVKEEVVNDRNDNADNPAEVVTKNDEVSDTINDGDAKSNDIGDGGTKEKVILDGEEKKLASSDGGSTGDAEKSRNIADVAGGDGEKEILVGGDAGDAADIGDQKKLSDGDAVNDDDAEESAKVINDAAADVDGTSNAKDGNGNDDNNNDDDGVENNVTTRVDEAIKTGGEDGGVKKNDDDEGGGEENEDENEDEGESSQDVEDTKKNKKNKKNEVEATVTTGDEGHEKEKNQDSNDEAGGKTKRGDVLTEKAPSDKNEPPPVLSEVNNEGKTLPVNGDTKPEAATTLELEEDEENRTPFMLPKLDFNVNGWGPLASSRSDLPYAPFNKGDRVGRISDWTQTRFNNRNRDRFPQQYGQGTGAFAYKHEEDDSSFTLVDNRTKQVKNQYGAKFKRFNKNRWNSRRKWRGRGGWRGRGRWRGRGGRRGYRRYDSIAESREPSVEIQDTWTVVEDIDYDALSVNFRPESDPANLVRCGKLPKYNTTFDRITPKNPTFLRRNDCQHFNVTTSADPIIKRLAKEKKGNVFGTDTIMALLMACPRSVNSWDIVVRVTEDKTIFFDKRPKSKIDFLSVNENWHEVLEKSKESINHPINLSTEATLINHNFSQQVIKASKGRKFEEPNPFAKSLGKGKKGAAVAYRYRRWDFGEDIKVVVRCALNGYVEKKGGRMSTLTIRALNEWDSKLAGSVPWRAKIESQTGAVLATEMKNNANKLARWTAELVLSGADEFRLGFVSRQHSKDSYRHSILMCKNYSLIDWSGFINIRTQSLWGPLKFLIEKFRALEKGTYLLMKDPNNAVLHIYSIPKDAFDNET